jgi:hypothetical protein
LPSRTDSLKRPHCLYFGTFYFGYKPLTCTKQSDMEHLRRYKVTLINSGIRDIPMATIQQRRKTDRERQQRWRKRKLAEGQKQILVMLRPEAQNVLKREKELTGEPYVQIINRLIMNLDNSHTSISDEIEVWPPG